MPEQESTIDTPDFDLWFQERTMPVSNRPHSNLNRAGTYTNYRRDMRNSLTGEDFFESYMRSIHGNKVQNVDGEEQRYNHRGDLILNHHTGPKEFEVKLERKGAETGRHAIEFGEYHTDYHGNVRDERSPGWFRSSKADIVVPVVPMPDGTVVLYPYDLKTLRGFLTQMATQAHRNGHDMLGEDGHLDRAKMLDVLAMLIDNSKHTMGPINTLSSGGYKRSRSLCVPYQFLIDNNLSKPYVIRFD